MYLDELPDCPLQHNPNNEDYGENVYVRSAWGNVEDVDYRSVVTLWYDEIAYYNFNTNQCSPPPGESCGHYTQVYTHTHALRMHVYLGNPCKHCTVCTRIYKH